MVRWVRGAAAAAMLAACSESGADAEKSPEAGASPQASPGAAARPGPEPATEGGSAAGGGLSLGPEVDDVFTPEEVEAARKAAQAAETARPSFSVCDAISPAQLSDILRQEMSEGRGEGPGCFWTSALPASDPRSKRVMIQLTETANYARAPGGIEAVLRQQSDVTARFDDDGRMVGGDPSKAEAVQGVGDQAFWRGLLAFRKGPWVANVDVQPRSQTFGSEIRLDPADKEPEIAIGKLLAAALP